MTIEEKLKRIKNSKYFFYKLSLLQSELKDKREYLEEFINKNAPAGYKKDLSIKGESIQQTKKNYSAEILFKDFEEKINKLKLEIAILENKVISLHNLIYKIEEFKSKYILISVFIMHLEEKKIKRMFKIKTNKDFQEVLNNSFIDFSFILENEYKKKK